MEYKTNITAEEGRQEIHITREFDLPVNLLFRAYAEPRLVEEWMGTKVVKLESRPHGSWRFETSNAEGIIVFQANGVIHEFVPDQKITRTFEMENTPFAVQLEFLEFEKLPAERSRLRMQIVYKSVELRDQMLQLPFQYGLNMAHDRLQQLFHQKN